MYHLLTRLFNMSRFRAAVGTFTLTMIGFWCFLGAVSFIGKGNYEGVFVCLVLSLLFASPALIDIAIWFYKFDRNWRMKYYGPQAEQLQQPPMSMSSPDNSQLFVPPSLDR
jgi:hypothetical protein